ncbi:hypothetical protein, partial [Phocaeicola barnesiae]
AGTFTSCKDYDDDINNLQEQINTIKTDLESLKATVDGLDGVKTLSFVDGTLIIETGKGTKVEVPVPSATDVEQTTVELDGQNLVVNGKVIGQVGDKVTVNEDGYLCVNGEATEIKAGKYAILENESDNTYTISLPDAEGNMHTITLLKSVATNIRIDFLSNGSEDKVEDKYPDKGYAIFSEIEADDDKGVKQHGYGIAWGVASSDIDWKGPKGAVKAGQLLVGQQNEVLVNVYPANVELDKQTLKLVDVNGNAAPVIIKASVADNAGGTTGSRAASNNGNWVLNITMDNTINGSNMGTAFASRIDQTSSSDWDSWENKKYALQVNGSIMTGYNYVIDTDEAACAMSDADALWDEKKKTYNGKVLVNDKDLEWEQVDGVKESKTKYSLGKEYELSFEQSSVYDYIFEIVDADKNDAEAWGIKLENNVLYAENSTKAAGKTIHLNVILLGVNGGMKDFGYAESTTPIAVTFGKVTSDVITLPVSEYKVTPNQYDWSYPNDDKHATITLDMGDFFSGLTAEEAVAATAEKGGVILETTDETFPFLRYTIVNEWGTNVNQTIEFYKADGETKVTYNDLKANIRNIKYAKVLYSAYDGVETVWNKKATLGQHILNLTLKDGNGNEIKKANVPVNVTVPSFFELFTKSAAWGDKTAVAVVDEKGNVDLTQLYNNKSEADVNKYFDLTSSFKANGETAGTLQTKQGDEKVVEANTVVLNKYAADGHSLRDLSSKLIYKIVPEVTSGAFWVNSGDFTMDLITKLDGAKFVYYVDGKETDIVVEPESQNVIEGFNGEKGNKRQGLSFYKAGKDNKFADAQIVNGLALDFFDDDNNLNYSYEFDDNAGDKATAVFDKDNGSLTLSGLAEPITADGYTTVLTITYKKAAKAGDVDIYETFKINLTVKK